jgi:hypothetical protein
LNNTEGCVEFPLSVFAGENTELAPSDLAQGLSPGCSDVAFQPGEVYTRPPLQVNDTLGTTSQVLYATSFAKNDGTVVQLRFTADGKMYANGQVIGSTAAGNRFFTAAAFGKIYIATSDGLHGADVPLQFDGTNLDRVSQDGPGAPPVFSASSITTDSFPIETITQPAQQVWGSSYFLQSAAPGSTAPGTTATAYYADKSDGASEDADLVAAFNSGNPVYLYFNFTNPYGLPTYGPAVVLVTNIGLGGPPDQPHQFYYFTFTVATSDYVFAPGSGHPDNVTTYQRTLATVTTTEQVPDLSVGDTAEIAGSSVAAWDSSWQITQQLDSGVLAITGSSITAGVATLHYTVSSGTPPTAGQLVTLAGLLNGDNILNNTAANPTFTIATASGGTPGTFTINGFETGTDYAFVAESGTGVTAGTEFTIDPGPQYLGLQPTNTPIFGDATGGTLTFIGANDFVAPGVRQGVEFFITRSGYLTIPSPPVTFTVPQNCNGITVSNLAIGPANVVARGVAFTGANGGTFFYLPVAAQLLGVTYGTSTVVSDNVSTSATFNFTDQSLLAATAIDIPGNDLFNQVVLGPVLGFFSYAGRLFAWGERNKIQQFLNMGFEGGTLSGSVLPLGWMATAGAGAVVTGGDYGCAWQITGGGTGTDGTITQPAFQDAYNVAILQPLTQYTFRLWNQGLGSTTVQLYSPSTNTILATGTVAATMAGGFGEVVLSAETPAVIPADTVLRIFATGLGDGDVQTLDEMELYYTANPYLRSVRASYIQNPEAFDGVTGVLGPASDPNEVRALFERKDVLHLLTAGPEGNLYDSQDTSSGEPGTWSVSHVASRCGAISVWGDDKFEDWQVWASDTGLRIYDGGSVDKMSQEEQTFWDSINPDAKQLTVVRNDPYRRRIYILAATGDEAITNTTYVLDYRDLNTSSALASAGTLRISFTGKMITTDLTRKWTPWTVFVNYCGLLTLASGEEVMGFCGAAGFATSAPANSTTYTLDEDSLSGIDADYGSYWDTSFYTTYGFVSPDEAQGKQLGTHRLLHCLATMKVTGNGLVRLQPFLGNLSTPGRLTRAVPMSTPMANDLLFALEAAADRVFYQIGCQPAANGGQAGFRISLLTVAVVTHPYSPVTGWNKPNV